MADIDNDNLSLLDKPDQEGRVIKKKKKHASPVKLTGRTFDGLKSLSPKKRKKAIDKYNDKLRELKGLVTEVKEQRSEEDKNMPAAMRRDWALGDVARIEEQLRSMAANAMVLVRHDPNLRKAVKKMITAGLAQGATPEEKRATGLDASTIRKIRLREKQGKSLRLYQRHLIKKAEQALAEKLVTENIMEAAKEVLMEKKPENKPEAKAKPKLDSDVDKITEMMRVQNLGAFIPGTKLPPVTEDDDIKSKSDRKTKKKEGEIPTTPPIKSSDEDLLDGDYKKKKANVQEDLVNGDLKKKKNPTPTKSGDDLVNGDLKKKNPAPEKLGDQSGLGQEDRNKIDKNAADAGRVLKNLSIIRAMEEELKRADNDKSREAIQGYIDVLTADIQKIKGGKVDEPVIEADKSKNAAPEDLSKKNPTPVATGDDSKNVKPTETVPKVNSTTSTLVRTTPITPEDLQRVKDRVKALEEKYEALKKQEAAYEERARKEEAGLLDREKELQGLIDPVEKRVDAFKAQYGELEEDKAKGSGNPSPEALGEKKTGEEAVAVENATSVTDDKGKKAFPNPAYNPDPNMGDLKAPTKEVNASSALFTEDQNGQMIFGETNEAVPQMSGPSFVGGVPVYPVKMTPSGIIVAEGIQPNTPEMWAAGGFTPEQGAEFEAEYTGGGKGK